MTNEALAKNEAVALKLLDWNLNKVTI